MIKKRYKQTEKIAQAQSLKQMLETLPVILAEIPLPEIEKMPDYNQVLRVRDINVAICADYVGLSPKRILIDKETDEEMDLNLFIPKWEITGSSVSAHVNSQGERELYEMEYYDDETDEEVTTDTEGNSLPDLENEVFLMPSVPYLMMFTQQVKLPILIEMFSHQFVADNAAVWSRLKEPI